VNLARAPFYNSGTFWAAVAIPVAILIGVASVWVTLRVANPKRRLYYWLVSDTPLITGRQDLSEELKVIYGHQELKSPRVVSVQLVSRGRRDIAREAFDDGKPLGLDLGTPIVECVKVTTSPQDRPHPAWTLDGSKLQIGPSHFGGRQTTVFSLLVDGESPQITPPQQSLVDVRIERGDGLTFSYFRAPALLILVAMGLLVWVLITPSSKSGPHASPWTAVLGGLVGVLAGVTAAIASFGLVEFRRRSRG
jgi:hypothetical protein